MWWPTKAPVTLGKAARRPRPVRDEESVLEVGPERKRWPPSVAGMASSAVTARNGTGILTAITLVSSIFGTPLRELSRFGPGSRNFVGCSPLDPCSSAP